MTERQSKSQKIGTPLSPKFGPQVDRHAARIEKRFGALSAGGGADVNTTFASGLCAFYVVGSGAIGVPGRVQIVTHNSDTGVRV